MGDHSFPRWVAGLVAGLLLAGGAAVGAWAVELPYYAFSPGPVGDAIDAVEVEGAVTTHPPDGELFMLTVSAQQVNAYELTTAALDPTVDLVRMEAIRRPDETDEEYQRRQLRSMDTSVQTAITVALDRLGIELDPTGTEVVGVVEGYPAAEVLEPGDVITAVGDVPVETTEDLAAALDGLAPGDEVEVTLLREGERLQVSIELAEHPDEPGRPFFGIQIQTRFEDLPVDIEPGNIGGPSAGMMYALAVIDLLDEEPLTRGHVVAGTGTLDTQGRVGAIGGVRQKVVAAEAAGAEVMLVPRDNYQQALTAPHRGMELVPVATIDDALSYLESLEPVGDAASS